MNQKRYTLLNSHIGGGSLFSQSSHVLSNLWKQMYKGSMSAEAVKNMEKWAFESEIEVFLVGGKHRDLENMYEMLQKIPEIPSTKFNESIEDLNGACTSVSFVASDRIVAINDYIRFNMLTPANAFNEMMKKTAVEIGLTDNAPLREEEVFVASKIAFMPMVKV